MYGKIKYTCIPYLGQSNDKITSDDVNILVDIFHNSRDSKFCSVLFSAHSNTIYRGCIKFCSY